MRYTLRLHPHSRCAAATGIDVDVRRQGPGGLTLSYIVNGTIAALRLPPVTASVRADELWRHTCFEAFVGPGAGPDYYEFNFAPSTQWAAYRFDGYRSGMRVAAEIAAPAIEMRSSATCYTLKATPGLDLSASPSWRLGLAAVLEAADGSLSYWALAHPPGKADFHHADCFTVEFS